MPTVQQTAHILTREYGTRRLQYAAVRLGLSLLLYLSISNSAAFAENSSFTASAEVISAEDEALATFESSVNDARSQMMRDPVVAATSAQKALELAKNIPDEREKKLSMAEALWLKAEALNRQGRPEEALPILEQAIVYTSEDEKTSAMKGNILLSKGNISSRLSDIEGAFKSYVGAHDIFVELDEPRSESIALQMIGSIYRDAETYESGLDYYERAAKVYSADDDIRLSINNNRANILVEIERYNEARELFLSALEIADEMDSSVLKARILTNLSRLEVKVGNYDEADARADEALKALGDEGKTEWARFIYGAKAHVRLLEGEYNEALPLIEKAFDDLDIKETSLSYEEMHDVAYQIYSALGDSEKALGHHLAFKRLSDSAKKIASSSNLALLGARFNFAEQQLNIERLNNEQMSKDLELRMARQRSELQGALIIAACVIIVFMVALSVSFRNHRNRISRVNKELETTISKLNDEIVRREKLEQDLLVAKDEAEQASRLKSTFLATMSHELRTPMNGILGFSKVLLSGKLDNAQREYLEIINSSGEALLTLINDILDLSQIEAGKLKLNPAPMNLRSTIEGSMKLLQTKAAEKNLSLGTYYANDLPQYVMGDSDRLRQIMINLIGNAVKFTASGIVVINTTWSEDRQRIRVAVRDTGIGIPDDKVNVLFQRFSQVDGTTRRKYGGTGLGLSITKELVEGMGGEIGVDTLEGKGSTFWFEVPLPEAAKVAEEETYYPSDISVDRHILVVDTLPARAKLYQNILESLGAEVNVSSSGRAALELMAQLQHRGKSVDSVIVSCEISDIDPEMMIFLARRENIYEGTNWTLAVPSMAAEGLAPQSSYHNILYKPLTSYSIWEALHNDSVDGKSADSVESSSNIVELNQNTPSGRILVVDDNAANRILVKTVLEKLNTDVVTANDGEEAIELMDADRFDVILMDVFMPVLGGVDATRHIRSGKGPNRDSAIIALTASDMPGDRERFEEAGMNDMITKPVDFADLRAKVKSYLPGAMQQADEGDGNSLAI